MEETSLSDMLIVEKLSFLQKEYAIIQHAIMIDEVLSFLYSKYLQEQIKKQYFSGVNRVIFQWIIDYFAKYKKAPKKEMQSIFDIRKAEMPENELYAIEDSLDRLAEEYDDLLSNNPINIEHVKENLIPKFVTEKEGDLLRHKLEVALSNDTPEKINEAIDQFSKYSGEDEDEDFGTIIPGSKESVKEYFERERERSLFVLPGAVGRLLGPFYRGSTYAVTGTEKSGKSFFCQEIGYQAVIFNRLKVLDINLEMIDEDRKERFWCRMGKLTSDKYSVGSNLVPIFDCLNNQTGHCRVLKVKLNKKNLIRSKDDEVIFYQRPDWKVCTKCRGGWKQPNYYSLKQEEKFIPAIWYKQINIKAMNQFRVNVAIKKLRYFGIDNYRQKTFPRFNVTFEEIYDYYRRYTKKANFKPDVVMIDYPDIMKPISGHIMDRHNIDYNWKSCGGFASSENVALIIADQTNKFARQNISITKADTSEDKRKDAHIDLRITLNKTEAEGELGLQRIGAIFKRKGRESSKQVMMLQNLSIGNPLMDSEFWPHRWIKYPVLKE